MWRSITAACCGLALAAAVLSGTAAAAGPGPLPEGPAGPLATMPGGSLAQPPPLAGLSAATARCPAPPYGPRHYAPGTGKTVALTFDDGPGKTTAAVLSILAKYKVPATFFNIGANMAGRPTPVRTEAKDRYVLGNHTWDHPDMTRLSAARQATEMDRANAEQRTLTGTVACVFRPPYGTYNATTLRLAQQRRMSVWLWSVDTEDWKAHGPGSDSAYWVQRIIRLAETEGGRLHHPVVLMHNQAAGNPATVKALPVIIKYFRSHGYRFVTL
ncbi:polysaccharide deacetylase family protein [Trebonia kvetii]|nr:polysaccharide deacetylase family protein [Trebonia kvetii]